MILEIEFNYHYQKFQRYLWKSCGKPSDYALKCACICNTHTHTHRGFIYRERETGTGNRDR